MPLNLLLVNLLVNKKKKLQIIYLPAVTDTPLKRLFFFLFFNLSNRDLITLPIIKIVNLAVENGGIFVAHDANRGYSFKPDFKWLKTTT
jgi:hypothetical protein